MTAAPTIDNTTSTTAITTTKPITDQKASASNQDGGNVEAAKGPVQTANGNVYGSAAPAAGKTGAADAGNNRGNNRGYNQGYSYNTGIKPYQTGYTYYQPFGDAAKDPNQQNGMNGSNRPLAAQPGVAGQQQQQQQQPQMPIELPNIFGLDPKQFGPVKVIPNQNVPVDENGIPQLDAIKIPQTPASGQVPIQPIQPQMVPQARPPVQMNGNDFGMGNDFNLNQILGGSPPTRPPQNNMFDFSPPASNNFDFDQNGGGSDAPDYNRLNNFAGNLNNFDTYLGDDPSLMMDPTGELGTGGGNGVGGGNNGGDGVGELDNAAFDNFANLGDGTGNGGGGGGGAGQQQTVPSEIVNLNNAFGSNNNQQNNNDMMNILNQLNGNPPPRQNDGMDFGNFGNAATNQNQFFPFF